MAKRKKTSRKAATPIGKEFLPPPDDAMAKLEARVDQLEKYVEILRQRTSHDNQLWYLTGQSNKGY